MKLIKKNQIEQGQGKKSIQFLQGLKSIIFGIIMDKTSRSNFTSLSFTVEDDLISQASISSYVSNRKFGKNPFSQNYPVRDLNKPQTYSAQHMNSKGQERIREEAHRQAYKQLNNELYNPFEHKLQGGFIPQEQNLYQKQKQRQIEYLRRKQEEELNNNKNYVILFNNNEKKSLKLTASNVLNEENYSIQDYYNKNIAKKRQMKQIPQNQPELQDQPESKQTKIPSKMNIKTAPKPNHQKKVESENNIFQKNQKTFTPKPQVVQKSTKKNPISTITKSVSAQKPKTSKQIKKPVNNYLNSKPQPKPNIPSRKTDQKKYNKITQPIPNNNNQNSKDKKKYSQVYQGPDINLVNQIETEIAQKTKITFQEIAELQNAKNLLQQAILLPKMIPDFFKGIRKPMKGILMFGPPGTGKTLLAKAVANDNMFFNVSASSLASKWKGQSQKMVRILFEMARYHSPSIIFFDEIDAIGSKRSEDEHESSRKVKTQLLVQMDGVESSEHQVFVLAATNRPWDLDEALRRRLEKRIYIPLPEKLGRKKMFEINLKEVNLSEKISWDKIVQETQGYSGADIANVCRDAAYMPMRRMLAKVGIKNMGEINQKELLEQKLTEKDLLQAIHNNKPSVNSSDLKKYQKWMKEFGSQ